MTFYKKTIIRLRTKDYEEIEKIEKYSQKNISSVYSIYIYIYTWKIYNNLGQKTRLYNNQQQQNRTCKIVYFAVPADYRIKMN